MSDLVDKEFTVEKVWPFLEKIEKTSTCWLWKLSTDKDGYGQYGFGGKMVKAHRLSYQMFKGKIPDNEEIDHLCRNRACVNPEHLESVKHAENMFRSKGIRRPLIHKKLCLHGHKLEGDNLKEYIENVRGRIVYRRRCLTCKMNYARINQRSV